MIRFEFIAKIRADKELLRLICGIAGRDISTVYRWLQKNDPMLTSADILDAICKKLNVGREEILIKRK